MLERSQLLGSAADSKGFPLSSLRDGKVSADVVGEPSPIIFVKIPFRAIMLFIKAGMV